MSQIPLHILNAHLFAAMLPETHGDVEARVSKADTKRGRKAAATTPAPAAPEADAPRYNAEQLAQLATVGVTAEQLTTMADADVDAILDTLNKTA